jgi:ATP-dependent DNA helicase RecQ
VFRREREVRFRKDRPASGRTAKGKKAAPSRERSELAGSDLDLFERLRSERLSIARELDVPPYVVFPDATLVALARQRPGTSADLLDIPGIGQTKRERFGHAFLRVIADFVES